MAHHAHWAPFKRAAFAAFLVAAFFGWQFQAAADDYPNRVVQLIVPFPPGGGVDTEGRVIAQKLSDALGQQVIVVNKPGAGSVIGVRDAAKAAPDGYTILMLVTGASLPANTGYDLQKDFTPIGLIASIPIVIMANPSVPVKTMSDIVALAKKEPGKLTVGTPPAPTLNYFGAEAFKGMSGADMTIVTYKGTGPLTTDLLGGHVMLGFNTLPPAIGNIKAGKIKRHRGGRAAAPRRDSRCADHRRSRNAGARYRAVLRAGGAGRHAARHHRTAQQGTAQDRVVGGRQGAHHRRRRRSGRLNAGRIRGQHPARGRPLGGADQETRAGG